MPRKTIYHADIEYLQILDENGNFDEELARDTLKPEQVKSLYEAMLLSRELDETAFRLQRSGRMGTYPPNKGSEATSLGAVSALTKGVDHLVGYYRENAALYLHGLPMHLMYLHWLGDERGNNIPRDLNISPMCIEIGAQILHAVGFAWAFKIRKEKCVVQCFLGDGATSTGDFHEGMNFASTFRLPCIFTCVNNGWAISVPSSRQTGSETFAQKGLAYGMPSVQVDGNDIFAVYKAHKQAVARAREGLGPSFIECVTYRIGDHTTADDSRRYRSAEEMAAWGKKDPIHRTRKFLESRGMWDANQQSRAEEKARAQAQEITRLAMETPAPVITDIFDNVFAELPCQLNKQRNTLRTDSIGQDPEQIGLRKSH
ncbi:MAG TPA: pyruvate dehydrogenase (acetyl-transferring) E1 component subunit alpha [Tepidisphaeraceae bacterium]|jgi:pyruvate dehydrogenase E1 component alpha subunit|nr:pyruvate dehydrogenase (acetyl-transferring) E1 component subunit alpha [Tepidisphaeraceae bacterium]